MNATTDNILCPNESQPKVTVVIVCYNHEEFVTNALESVKAQSYTNLEIIIIDDCSQDNSVAVISEWLSNNKFFSRFISHSTNIGLCRTLNEALALATGKYFSIISADDLWHGKKIELHVNAFAKLTENFCVVYSDACHIDSAGKVINESHLKSILGNSIPPSGKVLTFLLERNFIPSIGATIRTSALREIGGYDERLRYEDYDMWLRLSEIKQFFYLPKIVASWRILPSSLTHSQLLKNSPEISHTEFLISEKCLAFRDLDIIHRDKWLCRQWDAAYWLYSSCDRRAPICLWKNFKQTKNSRILLLILLHKLGINKIKKRLPNK
jgi:glycosyltransferase involved in cell wall biosynthesis